MSKNKNAKRQSPTALSAGKKILELVKEYGELNYLVGESNGAIFESGEDGWDPEADAASLRKDECLKEIKQLLDKLTQ